MNDLVFISHSSSDRKIAETICKALETRGCRCWISSRDIEAGDNFQEAIVKALRNAKAMLLVFTAQANNSNEIKKEIVLAGRLRVTVIPVRVEDVAPNDALAYEFATRQWIDLFQDWEREIDRLTSQIKAITPVGEAPAGEPDPPPAKAKSFRPPRRLPVGLAIGAAALLLAAGAGYGLYASLAGGDRADWAKAQQAGTLEAFQAYLKARPSGGHAEEAEQHIADLQAIPANTGAYDGKWGTTVSCPAAANSLGYAFQFDGTVANGAYHAQVGEPGKPGSLAMDGKVLTGGVLDLFTKGFTASSAYANGAPPGTPYFYHVTGKIEGATGTGRRVEGRPCALTFVKQ